MQTYLTGPRQIGWTDEWSLFLGIRYNNSYVRETIPDVKTFTVQIDCVDNSSLLLFILNC